MNYRNIFIEKYRCKYSGQEVDYLISLPHSEKSFFGLLVNLHSCHREPLTVDKCIKMGEEEMKRWAEVEGLDEYIVIHPIGYGNSLFYGNGERDVFECIEDTKGKYSINIDRIFLVGFSMGGAGALNIGAQNPSIFCGVCSISGYSDYRFWSGPTRKNILPFEGKQYERFEASFKASNFKHTNLLVAHGNWDLGLGGGVDFKFHKQLVATLDSQGVSHESVIFKNVSHAEFSKKRRLYVVKWMNKQEKKRLHGKFSFIISNLRNQPFYGIKIDSLIDYSQNGMINGEVYGDSINIETQNIAGCQIDKKQYKKKIINGKKQNSLKYESAKREGSSGPISDIMYTKVFFCYDDVISDKFSRSFQKEIAKADLNYYNNLNGGLSCGAFRTGKSFYPNETIALSKIVNLQGDFTIVCYGIPSKNKLIERLVKKMKIKIKERSISIPIGKVFDGEHGIRFICSNPNGGYYVVNTGTSESIISKSFGIWYGLLPDYIIFNHNEIIHFGYFDMDWHFSKKNFFNT